MRRSQLTRYAWLSIGAAIVTIVLKGVAYGLTGSVGLLSDAVESLVNLAGAAMALAMLTVAARPADEDHLYGHSKAEYFASGVEGVLILLAALAISATAVCRLITPRPLEQTVAGLAVTTVASVVNLVVARILLSAGRTHNSITLEADGKHLMTDVWTSVAVIAGVAGVAVTGWLRLDPLIAIVVSINILWTAYHLIHRSASGLMDSALPPDEQKILQAILEGYRKQGVQFHEVRTRTAAALRFIELHVLVPGAWTVHDSHHLVEQIEADIRRSIPEVTVSTHLEPIEDPISFHDGSQSAS
jgi:cation diffusion facilitator family transporter